MKVVRSAAVGAVAVTLSVLGAGVAQAAPMFQCEASALRAQVDGQPAIEPVATGREAACATTAGTPSIALPALLDAQALIATTNYDAAGAAGTADGGIAHLRVLPTPALIAQLPARARAASRTRSWPAPIASSSWSTCSSAVAG